MPIFLLVLAGLILPQSPENASDRRCRYKNPGIRVVQGEETQALQTRQVILEKGDSRVTLVGVLHVGEKGYYQKARQLLDPCDLVLFEGMVCGDLPESHPSCKLLQDLKRFYAALAKTLALETQRTLLSYDDPKWTRCDLSLAELMQDAPDLFGITSNQIEPIVNSLESAAPGDEGSETAKAFCLEFLFSFPKEGLSGNPANKKRNQYLLRQLGKVLEENSKRSIGILYGADHVGEFERYLIKERGYSVAKTLWTKAVERKQSEFQASQEDFRSGALRDALARERWKEAASISSEMIEGGVEEQAVFYSRGVALYKLKSYDEAIQSLDRAEKLKGLEPELFFLRGTIYRRLRQHKEARTDFEKYLRYGKDVKKKGMIEEMLKESQYQEG